MEVTVYSKPGCVQCNATYRAMDKKGVLYNTIDTSKDDEARDLVMGLGYMQAPVVVHKKDGEIVKHWSGFNPENIAELAEGAEVAA